MRKVGLVAAMGDAKKETKKIFIADDDLEGVRSQVASTAIALFSFWFVSVVGAFGVGHCTATPGRRAACMQMLRIIVPSEVPDLEASPRRDFVSSASSTALRGREPTSPLGSVADAPPEPDPRAAYEEAQTELLERVFDPKRWQAALRVGAIDAIQRPNADGTYDVLVPVSWSIDAEPILAALDPYFGDVGGRALRASAVDFSGRSTHQARGVVVSRQFNRDDAQKLPYTERLFDWLCRQQLQVVVSAGPVESRLTLATGRDCFVTCSGHGNRVFQLQLEHVSGDAGLIFDQSENEPVLLARVPAAALGGRDAIRVRVERREPPIRPLRAQRAKGSED